MIRDEDFKEPPAPPEPPAPRPGDPGSLMRSARGQIYEVQKDRSWRRRQDLEGRD
jgi:hypothetical protein